MTINYKKLWEKAQATAQYVVDDREHLLKLLTETKAELDLANERRRKDADEALRERWRADGAHGEKVKHLQETINALGHDLDVERNVNREGLINLNRCIGWIAHAQGKHPLDQEVPGDRPAYDPGLEAINRAMRNRA